jgi:hypothetical protein
VLENVSNRSNTPYAQRVVLNAQGDDVPESSFAAGLQFNASEDAVSIEARFALAFKGFSGVARFCQRSGSHLNASEEPEFYVFAQAHDQRSLDAAHAALNGLLSGHEIDVKRQALEHRITFRA